MRGADAGQQAAIDRLLSRPALSEDAAPYHAAFQSLDRDRPHETLGGGLGGSILIPRPVPLEAIRREGERLGYEGDGLEDFVVIVARIDDSHVELSMRREAEAARIAAARARKR